jgi:hypothetical protein
MLGSALAVAGSLIIGRRPIALDAYRLISYFWRSDTSR